MKKRKKEKKLPVLLLEDLPHLGQRGEVVLIKPGYFRYLISQKKALLATQEKLKTELKPLLLEEKIKQREQAVEELKKELEALVLEFKIKIGPQGQVFSPLTKEKISKLLKEKGFNISKSQIELKEKITQPGEYTFPISLGYDIKANLKINVRDSRS